MLPSPYGKSCCHIGTRLSQSVLVSIPTNIWVNPQHAWDVTLFGGTCETHSTDTVPQTPAFKGCWCISYNTWVLWSQILLLLAVNITGMMEPSLVGLEICFFEVLLPPGTKIMQLHKIIQAWVNDTQLFYTDAFSGNICNVLHRIITNASLPRHFISLLNSSL